MTGNRCGHDRHHIRRSLARSGSNRQQPLVLAEAGRAFARAIVERPQDFPELAATRDTDRVRRSERLEAIGLVVMAVMVRTDLLSLVVRWKGKGLPVDDIAKWTKCEPRRIRRAFFDLRWGSMLRGPGKFGPNRIPQPVEEFEPGRYRGKAAIRQVTELVFEKVGMLGWLKQRQAIRYAELHPEQKRRRPMTGQELALQIASVRREVRLLAGRPPPT